MGVFGGIRGLAQSFIRSSAYRGLSANETLDALKSSGLGYRRTNFLADYRVYSSALEKSDRIKYVRKDYRPTKDLYTETFGIQRTRYRYQVDIDVKVRATGDTFVMSTNVSSDSQLSVGEAEAEALRSVSIDLDRSKFDITGYHPAAAFHKSGETWD